jgi:hypothetical protein
VKAKSSKIEDCRTAKDLEICQQKPIKLYFSATKFFGICLGKATPVNCILISRAAKYLEVASKSNSN